MGFVKKVLPLAGIPFGLSGIAAAKGIASLLSGKKKHKDKPEPSLIGSGLTTNSAEGSRPSSLISNRSIY